MLSTGLLLTGAGLPLLLSLFLLLPAVKTDKVFVDGEKTLEGIVRVDGEKVWLSVDGTESELDVTKIIRIEWQRRSPELKKLKKAYRSKKKELETYDLARWCTKFGLVKEAKKEWRRVLKTDPHNDEAIAALGKKKNRSGRVVLVGPNPWDEIENGLTLSTPNFTIRGDLDRKLLIELAGVAERMNIFHTKHFGNDIGNKWKITLFRKRSDFKTYSDKIGSTQSGGGGYCEWGRQEFVGHGQAGHSFATLIKHELGHAYYRCPGPFWLREGAAILMESLEWVKGKPVIQPNRQRLRELKSYWAAKKHTDLRCCTLRPVFPLAYCHHWSIHYYIWIKKGPVFYRKMLKDLQNTKEKDDLTDRVVKMLGMASLEELEKDWKSFLEGI